MIVSVMTIKEHLRIDTDAEDTYLETLSGSVESAVVRWVGKKSLLYDDNDEVIPCVELAILAEVARQYIQREGPTQKNQMEWFERGYTLGAGATALLQPLRKPSSA